jgi:cob(I)alamin adenosyltransferase
MKIYTKSGDNGKTGLIGGSRVFKSDPRIAAYGQIDELNANIGLAISLLSTKGVHKNFTDIVDLLIIIQNDLFIIGSDLADPNFPPTSESKTPRVVDRMITNIERDIDKFESELEPISYFILPGGSIESSILHVCRGVARRAEVSLVTLVNSKTINKYIVAYVNRLSDLLFVLARAVNKRQKINDVAWKSEY